MLILKQNAANSVPTPPAGKGTIFLDDSDTLSVKTSDGNVENFPTVAASNAQVVFINGTSLSGESAFTYDFNNNVLNITGNVAAGNIKTDNLLYANGTPWDLSDPGGSNTEIQFNDDESFGGSAAFTFNKSSNLVTVSANLNANNLNATTHITAGNVWANTGTISAQTLKGEAGNLSNITAGNITGQVANALVAGTVYTAAQPNITSVGTLTGLAVTGNVTGGNVYANSGTIGAANLTGTLTTAAQPNITSVGTLTSLSVTGTATAGNLSTGGNLSVSGNAVISGNLTVDGNLVYVNVETLAVEDPIIQLQTGPNGAVPSSNSGKDVGSALNYYDTQARVAFMGWDISNAEFGLASQSTIANEVVTFNTYGNLRAGVYFGNAAGLVNIPGANITGNISGNISNADHATTANTVTTAAQPNITSVGTLSSVVVSGNANVANLNATANVNGGNVNATGAVVASTFESNVATGTAPMIVASTTKVANLNADLLDGFSTSTSAAANTVVIRDADGSFSANVVTATLSGAATTAGTVTTAAQPNITSVGTLSALNVSGNIAAPNITANTGAFYGSGAGLTNIPAGNISGQVANALVAGTVYTAAQPNITSVGTLSGLSVDGSNITLANGVYVGNGAGLTALAGANVTGTVANATHASTANTVVDAAQPNITSVGTLSSLTVSGNAGANNFNATTHVTAGNVWANSGTVGASLLAGTLTTAAQPNITSVGTLSSLTVTGNIAAGNIYANGGIIGAQSLKGEGGNISNIQGANVSGTVSTATTAGTVTTAAQPNITSVGTLSSLGVSGNITAANITANTGVFTGNAAGLTNIPGGNITGNITGNISNANFAAFAAEVTDSSQPNITSVGTLVDLTVTGNAAAGNFNTAGKVVASTFESNVTTGTAPLVVVSTTKVANLNADLLDGYSTATAATANTVVIRDADGSFSANIITGTLSGAATTAGTVTTAAQPNITSVGTLTSLGVNGTVTAVAFTANTGVFTGNGSGLSALAGGNVTGQVANALVAGTVYTAAQPNITSVGTLSSLTVTGNASAGNISTGGVLSVTGNANVGNLGTAGLITATGNVSGGNLTTGGVVAATGNVSGGNLTTAGALSVTGNANTGNLGTTTLIATTGNITTINSGLLQNGNSNIAITANGNVSIQAAGSTVELVVTSTGANISGTLNATGNANVGNIGAASGVFTNVSGNGSALSAITGANVTGQVANALVAGTVYTAAQPNITSVGTLTGLTMGGNVAMGNYWVTGLNSPVASTDAATKAYVDSVAEGLHTHDSCNAATDGTLATISGGTVTYNNGTSGVGATLTTTGSYTTIDGVTLADNMRILVKNEANAAHNGIYVRSSSTVLTRATDFDTPAEMAGGDFTFVTAGTIYDNTGWVMTDPVTTVGTTDVNWTQFSGAGTYTAGTGLTLTGSVFSVNASQTQITSVGTLGSLTVSGNASAGNISTTGALSVTGNANVGNIGAAAGVFTSVSGNGSALTALNASNISTGTLAQARLANSTLTLGNTTLTLGATTTTVAGLSSVTSTTFVGALTGAATTAGTVTTAAQPNITSVGTLSSLSVTGNISAGNVSATTFTGALSGAATTAGTVTTAAQPNITSVGTLTSLGVNGTVTAVAFTANTGVFTGNGSGLSAIAGANVTGTVSSATTAGTVTTAAQPNITSVGTLTGLTLAANADITMSGTGSNINGVALVSATLFAGSGANLTNLNGSNISTGTIAAARIATLNQNTTGSAATVTTNAQPNITSVSSSFTSLTFANAQTITGNNITFSTGANTNAGTLTGNFTLSTGSRLQATYADLAEKYLADAHYEEGTVLIFGGDQEVTISTEYDSHRVAGVVSHNAAYVMNAKLEGEHVIDLALTGRVPVKVHGPVVKGDLMVTGPNGHAVANNQARAGTILGKALQNFEGGTGIIEVVVGRV